MRKKNPALKFVWMLIFTTLTIVIWVGLEIYRAAGKTTVAEVLQEQLEPLDAGFDTAAIENLKKRSVVSEEELTKVPEIVTFQIKIASSEAELIKGETESESTF